MSTSTASLPDPGFMAIGDITLKGSQVRFSSFNTADPAHDDPLDANEIKANGGLASVHGVINVGNNGAHGKIWTGTNGGCVLGPRGFVGPLDWKGPGFFSPEWLHADYQADFKNVDPPFAAGFLPRGDGTNYWVLLSDDYLVDGDVELNNKVILVTGGAARLHVTGNFRMLGNSEIKIVPGATFKLYVGRPAGPYASTILDTIDHPGVLAAFQYYGLPSNQSITWTGNGNYRGTIYAPQATLTLGGSGPGTSHFMGACVVGEAVLNGHVHCHYDENLRKRSSSE